MSNAVDLNTRVLYAGTWGNVSFENFVLNLANGDAIASTHDVAKLPAGILPIELILNTTDVAAAASSTLDVGLKSVSGSNQDDLTHFFAVRSITSAQRTASTGTNARFTLAQQMYLRCTVRGAAQTDASVHNLLLTYRFVGNL
jgi:hypothetical protein